MRLELYQQETERLARDLQAMLDDVSQRLHQQQALSALEQAGVLHALQVLTENAIGKAKQLLKAGDQPVPVSAYDAFKALANRDQLTQAELPAWNAIIGLCNRIVHDYMNIDMDQVMSLIAGNKDQFVVRFLVTDFKQ